MKLIVGGQGQGKLDHVLKISGYSHSDVGYCGHMEAERVYENKIIYNLHLLVRQQLEQGVAPLEFLKTRVNRDHIIICNELGCGIVPIDTFERRYRDTVGEICCYLAEKAITVERICCGIAIKIKG